MSEENNIQDAEYEGFDPEETSLEEATSRDIAYAHTSYLHCDRCFLASRGCPKYRAGSQCRMGFDEIFKTFGHEEGVRISVLDLLHTQFMRCKRGAAQEEMTGGLLDKAVSEEFKRYMDMLKILKNLGTDEETIIFKRSGPRGKSGDGGSKFLDRFLGDKDDS